MGGLLVAYILGDIMWKTAVPLVAAYTTLILLHELGHAFVAKAASLKVHAVLVTAAGGWCFADDPHSFGTRLMFYAGGIIAQILALLITVILLALFDSPDSVVLNCFALVFTIVNVILIVINIVPTEGTDGQKIWNLLKAHLNAA